MDGNGIGRQGLVVKVVVRGVVDVNQEILSLYCPTRKGLLVLIKKLFLVWLGLQLMGAVVVGVERGRDGTHVLVVQIIIQIIIVMASLVAQIIIITLA